MKSSLQMALASALTVGASFSSLVSAEELNVKDKGNIEMCVDYYTESSEDVKKAYFNELDRRGQLSHQDFNRLPKGEVGPSSTICGMYMTKGKPMAEQSRQLRPMVFKSVHIYPDMYYVSQSGMLVEGYERKEGEMPPKLIMELPDVQPPPIAPK